MPTVQLVNISKKIKDSWVLENISYEFCAGKIYGLSGCNGSGKTMLLRMISGLIHPTSGKVYIDGQELHKDIDYPQSIGILIENPNFWKQYTGLETLEYLANIQKKINQEDIIEAMRRVQLNPDDMRTVRKYSLGMKQRLGIAQAIMEKPDVLLLDEPTNALDLESVERIRQIIKEECARGAMVIIASHNHLDLDICDKLLEMSEGKLIR